VILAEAVERVVDTWPGVGITAIAAISGWVTLYLKQRGSMKSVSEVDEKVTQVQAQVGKVQDQVANGHTTPLRTDLSEVLKRMELAMSYIEQLPNQEDVRGLRDDVRRLDSKIDKLEARVVQPHPEVPEGADDS